MLRLTALILFAVTALAQSPTDLFTKAPPDIDQALRARIAEFYDDHVKGDFRKAETLVAEETKEFFYDNNKPKYLSFEIQHIDYFDDFTRAKATIICEQFIMSPMFAGAPQKVPTPSYWKVENGKWYWYVPERAAGDWPFGTGMTAGKPTGKASAVPVNIPTSVEEFFTQVKADKQSVSVTKGGEPDQVLISNSAPGVMTLTITGKVAGVEATLDHPDLKSGERATLTVRATADAKSGDLGIHVAQTGQDLPVRVMVK